jgi:preprotein translocase subunit SecD
MNIKLIFTIITIISIIGMIYSSFNTIYKKPINLGIDFVGGTELRFTFKNKIKLTSDLLSQKLKKELKQEYVKKIQLLDSNKLLSIRTSYLTVDEIEKLRNLIEEIVDDEIIDFHIKSIGPKSEKELTKWCFNMILGITILVLFMIKQKSFIYFILQSIIIILGIAAWLGAWLDIKVNSLYTLVFYFILAYFHDNFRIFNMLKINPKNILINYSPLLIGFLTIIILNIGSFNRIFLFSLFSCFAVILSIIQITFLLPQNINTTNIITNLNIYKNTTLFWFLQIALIILAIISLLRFKLGIDYQGGTEMILYGNTDDIPEEEIEIPKEIIVNDTITSTLEVLRRRIDDLTLVEPIIYNEGNKFIIDLPKQENLAKVTSVLLKTGLLEFRTQKEGFNLERYNFLQYFREIENIEEIEEIINNNANNDKEIEKYIGEINEHFEKSEDIQVFKSFINKKIADLFEKTNLTDDMVRDAQSQQDEHGRWYVSLQFNSEGAKEFEKLTGDNVRKQLAIILDGEYVSEPKIREKIAGGKVNISGNFTKLETEVLANILKSGKLSMPVEIIKINTVSEKLAKKNKNKMLIVFLTILVITCITILFYKIRGLICLISIISFILINLGVYSLTPISLNIPSILGLLTFLLIFISKNFMILENINQYLNLGYSYGDSINNSFAIMFDLKSISLYLVLNAILLISSFRYLKGYFITSFIAVFSFFIQNQITKQLLLGLL